MALIQDELTLIDNKLWLTIGSRFEHNDYSGFEGQPSAKIMWAPHINTGCGAAFPERFARLAVEKVARC